MTTTHNKNDTEPTGYSETYKNPNSSSDLEKAMFWKTRKEAESYAKKHKLGRHYIDYMIKEDKNSV